jgi:hypothetical protein
MLKVKKVTEMLKQKEMQKQKEESTFEEESILTEVVKQKEKDQKPLHHLKIRMERKKLKLEEIFILVEKEKDRYHQIGKRKIILNVVLKVKLK